MNYKLPVVGSKGARYFGIQMGGGFHNGIDILVNGNPFVFAPCEMTITKVLKNITGYGDSRGGKGNLFFGIAKYKGKTITLQFGHCSTWLSEGWKVQKGEKIGHVDDYIFYDTGGAFLVNHVHFSVNWGAKISSEKWGYVTKDELTNFIDPDMFLRDMT